MPGASSLLCPWHMIVFSVRATVFFVDSTFKAYLPLDNVMTVVTVVVLPLPQETA